MGNDGAYTCAHTDSSRQRLCEYAMQAIVTKMSARNDSVVKHIAKIDESVEEFLISAVCFKSRIEKEIVRVSDTSHSKCTPFKSKLPSLGILKEKTLSEWDAMHARAFEMQARVSGLEKESSDDDGEDQSAADPHPAARKRSRDEFEAASS